MDSHGPFLPVTTIVVQAIVGQRRKESRFAATTAPDVQKGRFQSKRVSDVMHRAHQYLLNLKC